MNKTETLKNLEQALCRLLSGNPLMNKKDGKVSLFRINSEGGLSRGAIYYYKEFVEYVETKIDEYNKNKSQKESKHKLCDEKFKVQKLIQLRNKERRLKEKYMSDRDKQKLLSDEVVKRNVSLAFRLYELEAENKLFRDEEVIPFKVRT